MNKMLYWLIPLAIIVLIVLWAIGIYNRLVALREMVHNSMGQIAAQIESRWDALKSLIDATKSYQAHEADTLKSITESRTRVSS
ncbi:MAG: LemA family protein, partial [Peptoniphilaceae bacterium]|nr:LemA family protein [Peptoniphilaceae bacterium]MDY5765507.1 LemA family protein [Peptoniphilaceae bacterium]